jgi:hypothetical protein
LLEFRRGLIVCRLRVDPLRQQPLLALERKPRQLPLRLGRSELRALLLRVQEHQHVAFVHRTSGIKQDRRNQSRQIGAHGDAIDRSDTANRVQSRAPLFLLGDDRGHRLRRWLIRAPLSDRRLDLKSLH